MLRSQFVRTLGCGAVGEHPSVSNTHMSIAAFKTSGCLGVSLNIAPNCLGLWAIHQKKHVK